MRWLRLWSALALILAGGLGCRAISATLPPVFPWIQPAPTPAGYAQQMRDTVQGMPGWVKGVVQCFAPLRALGLDRETARDCRPKELQRDGQRILRGLEAIPPPAEVKSAHGRLTASLEELLKVLEERGRRPTTTTGQQFQAIAALEGITKALEEIGDFIGPSQGE